MRFLVGLVGLGVMVAVCLPSVQAQGLLPDGPSPESDLVPAEPIVREEISKPRPAPAKPIVKVRTSLDDLSVSDKKNELLFMEFEMAKNSHKLRPTVENKAKILRTVEKLINHVCMRDLTTTLSYSGVPDDPRCEGYIKTALSIDSANPPALCARDGIDARSCVSAYADQELSEFSPGSDNDLELDRAVVASASKWDKRNIDILKKQYEELMTTFRVAKTDQLQVKIARVFRKILDIACKYNDALYTEDRRIAPLPEGEGGAQLLLDPQRRLSYVLSKDGSTRQEGENDTIGQMPDKLPEAEKFDAPVRFKRTRMVAQSCINEIERVGREFQDWSMICYPHGFYTPKCIKSLRAARARNTSPRPRTPGEGSQGDGFTSRNSGRTGGGISEF